MTYVIEIMGKKDRILGSKRLEDTRVKACAIAKKNPGERIAIYDPSKMFRHPIEDITFYRNYRIITGELLNGYHIHQWTRNRTYRVSPVNGKLLDYNREWKWI